MTVRKQVGKYNVLRELGRGGMGIVYEAENPEVRHRVAIKLLDTRYAREPQVAARFRTEGIAANLPRHPGIVAVLERGLCQDDGAPYIVMEYVEGEPLRRRLRAYPTGMPPNLVIRIGKQVADAIAAAHHAKVIHRDIKPENVMLTPDSAVLGGERAKVLDFGIAVITNEQIDISQPDTLIQTSPFSGLIGTVYYMAPEQWKGVGRSELDDKADVYQFGILLYELLTGQPPFHAKDAVAIGFMHVTEEPKPLISVNAHVPPELAALIHRMLSKLPAERPEMKQVATVLERLDVAPDYSSGSARTARLSLLPDRRLAIVLSVLVFGTALYVAKDYLPRRKTISWRVSSTPPGADILGPAGQLLGHTPWRHERQRDVGLVSVTLRLSGYESASVQLDSSHDEARTVRLEPAR